jgi:hypothetical protein
MSLCLELFPWAKFRRAKGGVKARVLLDHDDYLPRYVWVTEAKRSDVKTSDAFPCNPGSIVAMDREYNDYGLFACTKWWRSVRLRGTATSGRTNASGSPASRLKRIAPACYGVWWCGMRRTNGRSVLLINLAALDSQCGQVPSSACPH